MDVAVTDLRAYPEVCPALAAARRSHDLSAADLDMAHATWDEFWRAVRPVELTRPVEQRAGELARRHGLRGADAIHLASALAVDDDIVVAVWDRQLHRAALAEGMTVGPRNLGS
jgi:predicted nucleic acid-binding protein